jgi:hypothetical protein
MVRALCSSNLCGLAGQAKRSFEAIGLKPYRFEENPIADLLNETWKQFQSQPESFARWEKDEIERLRKNLL